ncbi:SdpI family protein [Nocardiopsis sp. NRRL B-16309]|uniref:SdpI family protein n=1 Tax=Nocardiopsis sp. NRRL B-16309 TaxID=1519494 RepID=UPI0006AFCCDC|nr:SdpI family protein [Nocardiopsis sp. NRRL B-16309]
MLITSVHGTVLASSDPPLTGWPLYLLLASVVAMVAALCSGAYLGARGRISPNVVFGIRTAYTLGDDRAWYIVHRLSAPWTMASGVVMATSLPLVPLAPGPDLQMVALLAPMAIGIALLLTGSWRAHRTARAADRSRSDAEGA